MKKTVLKLIQITSCFLFLSCGNTSVLPTNNRLIPIGNENELGYINHSGEIIINPQFKSATCFSDGLALVRSKGSESKYGFIGKDGRYVISPIYDAATCFSDGMAWVLQNNRIMAINTGGEIVINLPNVVNARNFSEGLAAFSISSRNDNYWGFMDKKGNVIVNPQFEDVGLFNEGKCAVKNSDGLWGFIDKSGKIIINPQFNEATVFENGRAIVAMGSQYGVIDNNGKFLINPQFDKMVTDDNRYLVNSNNVWGWCDKKGKYIINPQFKEAHLFLSNSLAPVRIGNNWGYINKEGKIEINPQFEEAYVFDHDIALVYNNRQFGFIDKEGKYKINPQFTHISKDYVSKHTDGTDLMKYTEIGDSYYPAATIEYYY